MKAIVFLIYLFLVSILVAGIYLVVNDHEIWGWFLIIIAVTSEINYKE